jgi:hypothetical protein
MLPSQGVLLPCSKAKQPNSALIVLGVTYVHRLSQGMVSYCRHMRRVWSRTAASSGGSLVSKLFSRQAKRPSEPTIASLLGHKTSVDSVLLAAADAVARATMTLMAARRHRYPPFDRRQ